LCVLSASKFFSFSKVVLLVSFLLGSSSPFLLGGKNDNFDDVESGVSLHCPQETPATDSPIAGLISQPSITDGHSKPSITDGHSKPSITDLPYEVRLQSLNERPSLKERQRCCEEWSIQCSPEGLLGGTLSMSIEDVMDNIQHLRNMPESTKWNIEPHGEGHKGREEGCITLQSIEALDGEIVASITISSVLGRDTSCSTQPMKFNCFDTLRSVAGLSGKRFHEKGDFYYRFLRESGKMLCAKNIFMDLCMLASAGYEANVFRDDLDSTMQFIEERAGSGDAPFVILTLSKSALRACLYSGVKYWPVGFRTSVKIIFCPILSYFESAKYLFPYAIWVELNNSELKRRDRDEIRDLPYWTRFESV